MDRRVNSDLLKGLAIIAVVAIHSFSKSINSPISLFIDQLSRFSVPLFVALSGYGLSKSFENNNNLINYYLKRVWKVLPWFIFASLVIMIFRNWFENASFDLLNYHTWTNALFRGMADYHLYFVPMIFKLYLIFPILFFLVKKFPRLSIFGAFLWQVYLYWRITSGTEVMGNHNQIWPDNMQYLAPETWIYYLILGIYLAKNKLATASWSLVIGIIGFIATFAVAFVLQQSGIDSLVATRFTKIPVLIYATGFILFGLTLDSRCPPLDILGKYSFQIYLFHTIVLRLLPATISGFVLTPIVLILTLVPFVALDKVKRKIYK